jgi:hypothetical protein
MTSSQAQSCTQHLNNIRSSIYQKLRGGDIDIEMEMVLMVVLVM